LIQAPEIFIQPAKQKNIKTSNQGERVTLKEYNAMVKEIYYSR
jgi:hypothetical protein